MNTEIQMILNHWGFLSVISVSRETGVPAEYIKEMMGMGLLDKYLVQVDNVYFLTPDAIPYIQNLAGGNSRKNMGTHHQSSGKKHSRKRQKFRHFLRAALVRLEMIFYITIIPTLVGIAFLLYKINVIP